jgi:hypothetical protein
MRRFLSASIAALLVAGLALAFAAEAKGPFRERAQDRFDALPDATKSAGLDRADHARMFGKLTYDASTGHASGRFVSFDVDAASGTISNYRQAAWNLTFFSSVTIAPWTKADDPRVHGAVLVLHGEDTLVRAHNNPLTLLGYHAGNASATVTFHTAPGVTVDFANATNHTVRVFGKVGNVTYHGHLVLGGNGTITANANTVTLGLVPHGDAFFFAHPTNGGLFADTLHDLINAVANGRGGTVLNVVNVNGQAVEEQESLGDVDATTQSIGDGHLAVAVSGTGGGKVVVVDVDRDTLNGTPDKIVVKLDGVNLTRVSSAALATATEASVNVTETATGVELSVFVPHFSDHTIDATTGATSTNDTGGTSPSPSPSPTPTSSSTPGFGLALLAGAAAVAAIALRRR